MTKKPKTTKQATMPSAMRHVSVISARSHLISFFGRFFTRLLMFRRFLLIMVSDAILQSALFTVFSP